MGHAAGGGEQTGLAGLVGGAAWSAAKANHVVGSQWQLPDGGSLAPEAGETCAIDVTLTNVKLLP
jgi:hypothetical protein